MKGRLVLNWILLSHGQPNASADDKNTEHEKNKEKINTFILDDKYISNLLQKTYHSLHMLEEVHSRVLYQDMP